jgi:hypothetical protein
MRKLLYLGFCLALLMGMGCAITNYALMTEYWYGNQVYNTNGKAQIRFDQGVAFGDGSDWFFFTNFVDQKANGNRKLNTYSLVTPYSSPNAPWTDYFYCTPDWNGCAIWSADDPEGPDDPFDGTYGVNCPGAQFLKTLLSSGRYYGECGRASLPVADRINLLSSGTLIDEYTLGYTLNGGNTTIILDNNAGVRSLVPVLGQVGLEVGTFKMGHTMLDATNPLLANSARWVADWNDTYGTNHTSITVVYNGVVKTVETRLLSDGINNFANRL